MTLQHETGELQKNNSKKRNRYEKKILADFPPGAAKNLENWTNYMNSY